MEEQDLLTPVLDTSVENAYIMRSPFEDQVAELRSKGLVEKVDTKVEHDKIRRINEHMEMINRKYSEREIASSSVNRLLNH